MKANFWQILGGVLLVIGLAGYVYEKFLATPAKTTTPPAVAPAPATTAPATLPAP